MTPVPPSSNKAILIAELGHGGMADVYLALRHGVGGFTKLLVVKRLRAQVADEPEFLTMFIDEARLAARLSHTNVVQTHEIAMDGGRHVLEMEYLDGQPLHRIAHRARQRGRALRPALARKIVCDALAGLHYAHELCDYDGTPMNVVHRDVSPHNVFVTYQGVVKVVDFGIAKAEGQLSVTMIGNVKGKVHYMSPEHATGCRVDRRADVFAAGVVLWELLAGRRYWEGESQEAVLHRLAARAMPPGPRAVNADVPEDIDHVVARATATDLDQRYATAEEMRLALDACLPGDVASARELGVLASQLFDAERLEVRALIERAVERSRAAVAVPRAGAVAIEHGESTDGITLGPPTTVHAPSAVPLRAPRQPRSIVAVAGAVVLALGAALFVVAVRQAPPASRAGRSLEPVGARAVVELTAAETPENLEPAPVVVDRIANRLAVRPRATSHESQVARAVQAPEPSVPDAGASSDPPVRSKRVPGVDLTEDPWDAGAKR